MLFFMKERIFFKSILLLVSDTFFVFIFFVFFMIILKSVSFFLKIYRWRCMNLYFGFND